MEAAQQKAVAHTSRHAAAHSAGTQDQEGLTCRGRLNASCTASLRGGEDGNASCGVRVGVSLPEEHGGTATRFRGQKFKPILLYGLAQSAKTRPRGLYRLWLNHHSTLEPSIGQVGGTALIEESMPEHEENNKSQDCKTELCA